MNLLNAISEAGHPEIYQLLPFAKEFWLWVWLMGGGLTFLEGEDQMERGGGGGGGAKSLSLALKRGRLTLGLDFRASFYCS